MSEAEISLLFDWARGELDKIDLQAHGAKKRIVQDLALKLEDKLPLEQIAEEIVHQLEGKVSKTVVYESLDDKYKNQEKAANRKGKTKSVPLSEQTTAEQEQPITITNEGRTEAEIPNENQRTVSVQRNSLDDERILQEQECNTELSSLKFNVQELQDRLLKTQTELSDSLAENQALLIRNKELEGRVAELEYSIAELGKLIQPFPIAFVVHYQGKALPVKATADPQSRSAKDPEFDELLAGRLNA